MTACAYEISCVEGRLRLSVTCAADFYFEPMELLANQEWIISNRGDYLFMEHCTSALINQFVFAMCTFHCNKKCCCFA